MLTTCRTCKVKPSEACKHSTKGHVCSFRQHISSLVCLEMQALITLYPLFSLFPVWMQRSGQLWVESGLYQEGSGCLSDLGSWPHLLQMWEDAGNGRSRRRRENLAGRTEGFCLERLDFAMKFQQNSGQVTWLRELVTPRVCFPFCEEPSLIPWVALTCQCTAPNLQQKISERWFEMRTVPITLANLRGWQCTFDFKCRYFCPLPAKRSAAPSFLGVLWRKKWFLWSTRMR